MMLKVAVQMDPIASINPMGDSTFAMMLEAQSRGHKLDYYTVGSLGLRDNVLTADTAAVEVFDKPKGEHFKLGDASRKDLSTYDVVLMRQDPPFDMNYITISHMLERIHPKTYVVNPPSTVRNAPEKILVTDEAPICPLYYFVNIQFYDPERLGGIEANLLDEHPIKAMYWKKR